MRPSRLPVPTRLPTVLLLAAALVAPPSLATPLEDNRRITEGYTQLAYSFGSLLDPALTPGGSSGVRPNWFVFAPHASRTAGEGMLGAAVARRLLDTARARPWLSLHQALDGLGLTGEPRLLLERLGLQLLAYGVPLDAAASLAALTTAMNLRALADPRTLVITASRLSLLYWSAPALLPLDKAERVVVTLERTLHEGNLAIFGDIGGAGSAYLDWRRTAGEVTPERVLAELPLEGAVPEEARRAYDFARAHAHDTPRPSAFDATFPGMRWRSLVVAAFALYEAARLAPTPQDRDALAAMANNYVAWREQYEVVQPLFAPAVPRADEVSRAALMRALSPLLKTDFGALEWTYAGYAYAQPDRDGNPLTSQPTEYGWALFGDRWAGILDAFDGAYLQPTALWVMPEPLEAPPGL